MNRMHRSAPGLGLALMLLAVTSGCSDSNLGLVTGTVTLDGRPVVGALVTFKPQSGQRPSAGMTDEQGNYELTYSRDAQGAVIGIHDVEISTYDEIRGDDATETIAETIPAHYNVNTELAADVMRGANVIDFELESGGEILLPED